MWIKFSREFFDWEQNTIVCMDQLNKEAGTYKEEDNCLLICSDFNARVDLRPDYVQYDDNDDFLPLPETYISDNERLLSAGVSHDQELA